MSRFSRLSHELAAKGAHNPDALAAYIGRKKYGRAGFATLAKAGRAKKKATHAGGRSADITGMHYRSFTPELEVRQKGDGRTIVGIAVPYGRAQYISPGLTEQFRSGAFDEQLGPVLDGGVLRGANRVPFTRDHMAHGGALIGRATVLRNDAAGLYGEFRVSRTDKGDETLELVKDGALSELSIGFRERTNANLPGGVTERVAAELREVAVVMQGAYGEQALVSAIRAAGLPYAGPPAPRDKSGVREVGGILDRLPKAPGARR